MGPSFLITFSFIVTVGMNKMHQIRYLPILMYNVNFVKILIKFSFDGPINESGQG